MSTTSFRRSTPRRANSCGRIVFVRRARAPAAPGGSRDGDAFCARLLDDAGLAIVPGSAFRTPEWVRVSYAADQSEVAAYTAARLMMSSGVE